MPIIVAVIAIGIFALPGAISMFGGQHDWYDLLTGGNQVPCVKCHANVHEEISDTGPHRNMSCSNCHRTGNPAGYTYASGDGIGGTSGEEAHAASTVECLECHGGSVNSFLVGEDIMAYTTLEAGGFNLTTTSKDTGLLAAHQSFVQGANESELMEGENEACIACHTYVAIDINWTNSYNRILLNVDGSSGDWIIG